jgi:lipoate-protein ligase A
MEKIWRLIIDGAREPEINMAVDEAIMLRIIGESITRSMAEMHPEGASPPTLRIYRWPYPCISIGKFQRLDGIPLLKSGVHLVRRPTGGGSVYHNEFGLTYSIIYREDSGVMPKGVSASYRHIHEGVAAALKKVGVEAGLYCAVSKAAKAFGDCFDSPVEFDIISAGKKVGGAAQRRRFGVVLHEGEVSLSLDVWRKCSYNTVLNAFINSLSEQLHARFLEGQISKKENSIAEELLMERMEEVTR